MFKILTFSEMYIPAVRCPGSCSLHGICRYVGGVFSCVCDLGFVGDACEVVKDESAIEISPVPSVVDSGGSISLTVVGLVVVVVALLALVGFFVFVERRRRQSFSPPQVPPSAPVGTLPLAPSLKDVPSLKPPDDSE